jgi:hypothetical protein
MDSDVCITVTTSTHPAANRGSSEGPTSAHTCWHALRASQIVHRSCPAELARQRSGADADSVPRNVAYASAPRCARAPGCTETTYRRAACGLFRISQRGRAQCPSSPSSGGARGAKHEHASPARVPPRVQEQCARRPVCKTG